MRACPGVLSPRHIHVRAKNLVLLLYFGDTLSGTLRRAIDSPGLLLLLGARCSGGAVTLSGTRIGDIYNDRVCHVRAPPR